MLKATADAEAGDGSTLVNAEDTVPPKVEFKNRNVTDKWWGVLYILSYISFITCGFVVASQAKERYIYTDGVRTGISEHYQSDVETCCLESGNQGSACYYLNSNEGRRLQSGTSKFDGDEGIFEVFIEAPEIIVGLCGLTIAIAITWFAALRFFAKQVVILSELCKIALFIVFGIYANETQSKAVCFLVAAALVGYAYWARNKILFAAKMISHSTIAMKENPSIFLGGIFAKTLYAGNAALFVYFFAESINVVKVEKTVYPASSVDSTTDFIYCDFASPSYVSYINIYLAISYLWSVLLFEKMRLSTVAGVVGSWHFHPEEKPTLWITIKNIAPSFGTLSVSALISSIAEYVNKVLNQNQSFWVYISPLVCVIAPLHILICFFGTCMKTVIQMLTKYAVILHVFTGKPFMGSAKSVFKIMSRHFKGGFVTEVTSKSVLNLGSYAFSVGISMVAWKWVDDEFDCNTLSPGGDGVAIIGYFFVLLFFVWYPVLGIYVMILLNQTFQRSAKTSLAREGENFSAWNHHWIPPLTACFVGSIAMMLFLFLSSIFLDTIDTLFLCFAIDKDNNVLIPDEAFVALVSEMPSYTGTQSESSISLKEEEPAQRKG